MSQSSVLERARTVIEDGIKARLHLGAQLYVSRDGKTVGDLAFGEAREGVAMRPDTLMLWMSSVKPITAVAIAQMWERGKLDLDDPVARHIPEFCAKGKERVTIRHVLTHTGGFRARSCLGRPTRGRKSSPSFATRRSSPAGCPASGWAITSRRDGTRWQKSWAESTDNRTRNTCARKSSSRSACAIPGSGCRRKRHREYAAEQRIAPMHFSTGLMKPIPHNYPFWSDSVEALAVCRPGGSARGPIHDLGKFYEAMLAGGGNIIEPQTVEAISARHLVGMRDRTFGYPLDRGLGVVIDSKQYCNSATWFGNHCSKRTWGHAGYVSSVGFVDPPSKTVVALVFNGMLESQENRHDARMISTLDAIYADLGLS